MIRLGEFPGHRLSVISLVQSFIRLMKIQDRVLQELDLLRSGDLHTLRNFVHSL